MSRATAIIVFCHFLASFSVLGMSPYYPTLLEKSFGLKDPAWGGIFYALPLLVMALASPLWGGFADRFGKRLSLQRAQLGLALALWLCHLAPNLASFSLCIILQGLFGGTFSASNALLSQYHQGQPLAQALSTLQYSARLGLFLAPSLLGLLMAQVQQPTQLYGWLWALPLVSFLLLQTALPTPPSLPEAPKNSQFPLLERHSGLDFSRLMLTEFVFTLMTVVTFPYFVKFFQSRPLEIPQQLAGFYFGIPHIIYLLLAFWVIRQANAHSAQRWLRWAFLGLSGSMLIHLWPVQGWPGALILGGARILMGLALVYGYVFLNQLFSQVVRPKSAGWAFGWLDSASKLAGVLAGLLAGGLVSRFGLGAPFGFSALLGAAAVGGLSYLGSPKRSTQADARSAQVLLNCYQREYLEPKGIAPDPRAVYFPRLGLSYPLPGNWQELARLIVEELGLEYAQPFNQDLLDQVDLSHQAMSLFLQRKPEPQGDLYLYSEQLLSTGHAYHPAPKARQGMSLSELKAYSPELQARFQLFYFEVAPEAILQRSNLDLAPPERLGLHPWQAQFVLQHPELQPALKSGAVQPLGCQGPDYYPTASLRTLYHPQEPYFLKQSLHLRLTNCLRKNAWYELESALLLDRLLAERPYPGQDFTLLREPCYTSLHWQSNRFLLEAFSTIYREALPIQQAQHPVVMTAALFGGTPHQELLQQLLPGCDPLTWFRRYTRLLLWPTLYYASRHGIIFEPHLQNCLLEVGPQGPLRSFFRDLEGTKLEAELWADKLQGHPPEVVNSLLYSSQQSWQRLVYCLIFNQLSEVVQYFPQVPARQLWSTVAQELKSYLEEFGCQRSQALVQRLLQDERLPVKGNLITRFLKSRDRQAAYLWLENPLR